MSVSRLTHLVETDRHRECLQEAAALLAGGDYDPAAAARIYACICRSALALAEYEAAIEAGEKAEQLAREAGAGDLLGAVLVDLGTAHEELRQFEPALQAFGRYRAGLETYTAARCLEGTALQRMARVCAASDCPRAALELYRSAQSWFERFGDAASARACSQTLVQLHLQLGEVHEARAVLGSLCPSPGAEPGAWCDYLLDWAACHLAVRLPAKASQAAFAALELAENDLPRQARAQLLLSRSALAEQRGVEAFSFALAARISAIDGRLYATEFEATQLTIDLLRTHGRPLLLEAEGELARQGVNLYDYLPREALSCMTP